MNKKVLIVDDEVDICYLICALLKNRYATSCAYTLAQARKEVKTLSPDIIFLDNHLADGEGTEIIEYCRQLLPEVKIIFITAYESAPENKHKIINLTDYYIKKPLSSQSVNGALETVQANS